MTENKLSKIILNTCFEIHHKLGPGLFESVYEEILSYELEKYGLNIKRQHPIPVYWEDRKLNLGFKADLIVEGILIVEIKSVEQLAPVHKKQLLTYLRLTNVKLGLLINFNEELLKSGIRRVVNGL